MWQKATSRRTPLYSGQQTDGQTDRQTHTHRPRYVRHQLFSSIATGRTYDEQTHFSLQYETIFMCSKADVSGSLMYGTAPKLKKEKLK